MLVETQEDLSSSIKNFMDSPEYWRDAIGSNPKYFICLKDNNLYQFGLSKFCAFKDIDLEEYIIKYRHTIGGGKTQKHISKVCDKEWLPLKKSPPNLQSQFSGWFYQVTNGSLKTDNIYIIILDFVSKRKKRRSRKISPDFLEDQLERQKTIGEIGEKIAVQYEKARLESIGIKNPDAYIQQVSLLNVASGFDIRSRHKKSSRYIEVKSATRNDGKFFISINELETLKKLGDESFIYIVHITDLNEKEGNVVMEIQNPVLKLEKYNQLLPVLYQAEYKKKP